MCFDAYFTVEVDYYDAPNATHLDTPTWRRNIKRNLALYGFDARLERNDTISQADIESQFDLSTPTPPFSATEIGKIETGDIISDNGFRNTAADSWMFVANNSPVSEWGFTGTGDNFTTPNADAMTILGREAIIQARSGVIDDDLGTDIEEARNATRIAATLHELGHFIDSGEADERETTDVEIYSGTRGIVGLPDDFTPEEIQPGASRWSIMGEGWDSQYLIAVYGDNNPERDEVVLRKFTRYAYSIEEVSTITNDKINN